MAWKGFVVESKLYMHHPDCWKEWNCADVVEGGWTLVDKRRAALKFWLAFPKAAIRFYWLCFRDWTRRNK